jgi:UDP-glucose 4-epimerase
MIQLRNILILGGGGFIGRTLATRLSACGHTVTCVDTVETGSIDRNVTEVVADLTDASKLVPLLCSCDTIVHLASATTPASSANHPTQEAQHNLAPTLKFLEMLPSSHSLHLLFLSSGGTVYGAPEQLPATELAPLLPQSYHAAGKIALEAFLGAYRNLSGHSITILRPSNIYGPGQPLRPGFGIVRHILENVHRGRSVTVWGDGENIRDYLYIDDMVAACQRLIEQGNANATYNVGAGVGTSINALLKTVEQVIQQQVAVEYFPARAADVRAIVLDSTKLREVTGWIPQTDLAEGIRRTWQSILNR